MENNFLIEIFKSISNHWFYLVICAVVILPLGKLIIHSLVSVYTIKVQNPTKIMISITDGSNTKIVEISSHSLNLKNIKEIENQLSNSNAVVLIEDKKEAA